MNPNPEPTCIIFMGNRVCLITAIVVLSLATGCDGSWRPTYTPQTEASRWLAGTLGPQASRSSPACEPSDGEGTVSPDVSITSIVFVVDGVEQVVRDGDILQTTPGVEVSMKQATICADSFSGDGGEACVDLVPIDASGREILAEHAGTHLVQVTAGSIDISGPEHSWIIGETWSGFSAALNHWPPEGTADTSCAVGRCEHDDRMSIRLQ